TRHCRRGDRVTRRGGAAAWPLAVRAQQADRTRRIGVLMPLAADDPVGQARIAALHEGLEKLGWIEGRNIRIDTRWTTTGDVESMQRYAKELVALSRLWSKAGRVARSVGGDCPSLALRSIVKNASCAGAPQNRRGRHP